MVLLFDSWLKLLTRKLNLKWKDIYRVVTVFPYCTVKLENKEGMKFKVNGQRMKQYLGENKESRLVSVADLKEASAIKLN